MLIELGADRTICNSEGLTPADRAERNGNLQLGAAIRNYVSGSWNVSEVLYQVQEVVKTENFATMKTKMNLPGSDATSYLDMTNQIVRGYIEKPFMDITPNSSQQSSPRLNFYRLGENKAVSKKLKLTLLKNDFLDYCNTNPINFSKIIMVDWCQQFIAKQYDIYISQNAAKILDVDKPYKDILLKHFNEVHGSLALELLFGKDAKQFSAYSGGITKDNLKAIGIIHEIEGKTNFVHRTFAEYFAAEILLNKLTKEEGHPEFKVAKDFILLNIFKARNFAILNFLEQLIKKANEPTVNEIWGRIKHAIIVGDHDNKKNSGLISITNIPEALERDSNAASETNGQVDLNFLRNKFNAFKLECVSPEGYPKRIDQNKALQFFKEFNQFIFKVTCISFIEEIVQHLNDIAKVNQFNILKKEIILCADSLLDHYFTQIVYQGKRHEIKLHLFEFKKISSTHMRYSNAAKVVYNNLNSVIRNYKNRVEAYNNMNSNITNGNLISNLEFPNDLTAKKIFQLIIANHIFTTEQLKFIIGFYKKWNNDEIFGKTYKNLLFQINEAGVAQVKQFFIQNNEHDLLIKLFVRFPTLTLTKAEINNLYEQKSSDLFWLERQGVEICCCLKILDQKMVDIFVKILNAKKIDGYITVYAQNIFDGLLPLLNNKDMLLKTPNIDKSALLAMFVTFLNFSCEHNVRIKIKHNQISAILKLIELRLNRSGSELSKNITSLSAIIDNFGLKLIDLFDKELDLLVLEPNTGYSIVLQLERKPQIIELIKCRKNNLAGGFPLFCQQLFIKQNTRNVPNGQKNESDLRQIKKLKLIRNLSQ